MSALDVSGAAGRLLANKSVTPGHCLMYVSRAIRNGVNPLIWQGLDTAYNCWLYACGGKESSRNVPAGFPAFLGPRQGSPAGDVIISLGNGTFAATDWPRNGVVGVCTLAQREKQTGRTYLGYARQFLGYTLTNGSTAGGGITPIPKFEQEQTVRIIQDTETSKYYRLGEFTAMELAASVAKQEVAAWHPENRGVAVSHSTALQLIADATAAGKALVAQLSAPSAPTAGASKADVDAAADRVIGKIPSAEQNGQAARTAIVK